MTKRLLLLSNSTNFGEEYLLWPRQEIKNFLGDKYKTALFVPYAGVTISWDEYYERVKNVFDTFGCKLTSIHNYKDPVEAVKEAEVIIIGGGNTFQLVKLLYDNKVMSHIKEKVENSTPFIGWSAGSNVACPSLKTTNDMPIAQPLSFETLNLVPFQINPHFTEHTITNHGGETRIQRINEFLVANPDAIVVGLREGTLLRIEGNEMRLVGDKDMVVFINGIEPKHYGACSELSFLI